LKPRLYRVFLFSDTENIAQYIVFSPLRGKYIV